MRVHLLPLAFAALASLASATTYSMSIFAPDTAVDGAQLNAAGQAFYTGISGPSTYCPTNMGACPDAHKTLVYAGMTGMAVEVPGGQSIYVHPSGLVQYARAHSTSIPNGGFVGGWYNVTVTGDCMAPVHVLTFLPPDSSVRESGVTLCPDIPNTMAGTSASYALYAKTARFNQTNCIDAIGLLLVGSIEKVGSWQYL